MKLGFQSRPIMRRGGSVAVRAFALAAAFLAPPAGLIPTRADEPMQPIHTLPGTPGRTAVRLAISRDGSLLAVSQTTDAHLWALPSLKAGPILRGGDLGEKSITGHDTITRLAISPGNEWVAVGGYDARIVLWDRVKHERKHILKGHTGIVVCVEFLDDGKTIFSACRDQTARFWDVEQGRERSKFTFPWPILGEVLLAPKTRLIATGDTAGAVHVYDLAAQKERYTLEEHQIKLGGLAFSPDETILASGDQGGKIALWDLATGALIKAFTAHHDRISEVCYSPDGRLLVSAARDLTITIWDARTTKPVAALGGLEGDPESVVFTPDGRWIIAGGRDQNVRIWDVSDLTTARAP